MKLSHSEQLCRFAELYLLSLECLDLERLFKLQTEACVKLGGLKVCTYNAYVWTTLQMLGSSYQNIFLIGNSVVYYETTLLAHACVLALLRE